jgi:hypothetical protein
VTASQASRQKSQAHPCPPWCVDHDEIADIHKTRRVAVKLPDYAGYVSTISGQFGLSATAVGMHGMCDDVSADLYVPLADAGQLAGLLEILAYATPGQYRELAAAIRQAAADITEAGQ